MSAEPAVGASERADPQLGEAAVPDPRRWLAQTVIAAATLVVVLDTSIVHLALPEARAELGMSDATRGWVVTATSSPA